MSDLPANHVAPYNYDQYVLQSGGESHNYEQFVLQSCKNLQLCSVCPPIR